MRLFARSSEVRFTSIGRRQQMLAATVSLLLLTALSGLGQSAAKKPIKAATEVKAEIKEELSLKNGERLTGQLLNSTGKEIKFKSDLAGEVTVARENLKKLKTKRDFAIIPKDVKNARDSASVPQGAINIGEKGIVVSAVPATKVEASTAPTKAETKPRVSANEASAAKEVPASKVAFIVDDASYSEAHTQEDRLEIRLGWSRHHWSGDDLSTQNRYVFQVDTVLKRTVPTVSWLDPELRTIVDFTLSAGKTTQSGTPETITNIYHVGAERDEYFSPRGYYLQSLSFDQNYSQGLVLQQSYGGGVGATLFKKEDSEWDVTSDLHYESQQFKATADVSELSLHLIGSTVTEAYPQKWGKISFDEKLLADMAFNNASAFSASGTSFGENARIQESRFFRFNDR